MTRQVEELGVQFLPLPPVQKKVGEAGGESSAHGRDSRAADSSVPTALCRDVRSNKQPPFFLNIINSDVTHPQSRIRGNKKEF